MREGAGPRTRGDKLGGGHLLPWPLAFVIPPSGRREEVPREQIVCPQTGLPEDRGANGLCLEELSVSVLWEI